MEEFIDQMHQLCVIKSCVNVLLDSETVVFAFSQSQTFTLFFCVLFK